MLANDELIATLQKCVEVLKPYSGKQLGSSHEKLEEFLVQLQCLEGKYLAIYCTAVTEVRDMCSGCLV